MKGIIPNRQKLIEESVIEAKLKILISLLSTSEQQKFKEELEKERERFKEVHDLYTPEEASYLEHVYQLNLDDTPE